MRSTSDWNIILTCLLCIAILIISDLSCKKPKIKNIIDTDTVTVSVVQRDTIYRTKLKPVYRTVVIPDTIIDTAYVVVDYNTINTYIDTIADSNYNVIIFDTIWKNAIYSRKAYVSITHTKTTITNTVLPRNHVYVGLQFTAPNPSIGGVVYYNRDKDMYGLGYNPFNRSITIGYSRKLFSR